MGTLHNDTIYDMNEQSKTEVYVHCLKDHYTGYTTRDYYKMKKRYKKEMSNQNIMCTHSLYSQDLNSWYVIVFILNINII